MTLRSTGSADRYQYVRKQPSTNQSNSAGQNVDNEPFRDQDPTPRASHEPWRFTPSLLDPNSYAFNSFANAPPGYYTPTPGGNNTLFHSQAGDLHLSLIHI